MATRIERYSAARTHAAELAESHALGVLDGNMDALEGMRQYGHERDAWDRQLAWINREHGVSWPATPAWCD